MIIKIFARPWTLEFIPAKYMPDNLGLTYQDEELIIVRDNIAPVSMADTIIHELLHAATDTLALNLTEQQVHQTATALTTVLADNLELRNLIFSLLNTDTADTQEEE